VRTFVIGKDLCPFAAAVEHAGKVRFAAFSQTTDAEPLTFALQEAVDLLMTPPADLATTIVVYPTDTCGDFESFLDLATELEGALSAAGADGVLQVATFHPDYVFEGATADDPANATNRSPSPMLHLLREDDVAAAVRAHPNPASIPKRNAALLRREAAEALVNAASS
jgi:uncharacterized protein